MNFYSIIIGLFLIFFGTIDFAFAQVQRSSIIPPSPPDISKFIDTTARVILVRCEPSSLSVNAANTQVSVTSAAFRTLLQQLQISDADVEPAYYGLVGGIQQTTMTGEIYFTPNYSNIIKIKIPQNLSMSTAISSFRSLSEVFSADFPIRGIIDESSVR